MILKFWLDQYLEEVKYLRLHLHEYHTAWYDVEMILLRNHRRKTRRVLDWNWFLSASDLLPSAIVENHRDSSNVKWIFLHRELEVVSNRACLNNFDDIYEVTILIHFAKVTLVYGGYPIIKQKVCERVSSCVSICMKTLKTLDFTSKFSLSVRKP